MQVKYKGQGSGDADTDWGRCIHRPIDGGCECRVQTDREKAVQEDSAKWGNMTSSELKPSLLLDIMPRESADHKASQ